MRIRFSVKVIAFIAALMLHGAAVAQDDKVVLDAKSDVRILIDISGSMKQNDPDNLRRTALELLVQLFPDDAKAGVWTFGQWVNMLVKHGVVDDAWRQNALETAKKINSAGLYTNIGGVLENAAYDFGYSNFNDGYPSHSVILLTDGVVDISRNEVDNVRERQRIIDEVVKIYQDAGVVIHSIALSRKADQKLLQRLAVDTGGIYALAETAEDLMRIFLQAFDAAVPSEQLPLQDNRFSVDSSVDEFTALVFREPDAAPTQLQGPDESIYQDTDAAGQVRWFSSSSYDLITVRNPLEGEWSILAEADPDNRVTVVSNLGLAVGRLPNSTFIGDELDLRASLKEDGAIITRDEFLSLIRMEAIVSRDGQEIDRIDMSASGVPSDGTYRTRLAMFDRAGEYDVNVKLDGNTFERQQRQIVVIQPMFSVNHQLAGDQYLVDIFSQSETIDSESVSILGTVSTPGGANKIVPVSPSADREWVLKFDANEDGIYTVSLDISGQLTNGDPIRRKIPDLKIRHNVSDELVSTVVEPEPQPEPEPEPEPEPVEEPASDEEALPEIDPVLLWGGIAAGNLLILGLGYLAYRIVMGAGRSDVLEDDADDNTDIDIDESPQQTSTESSEVEEEEEDVGPSDSTVIRAAPEPEPEPEPEVELEEEPEPVEIDVDDEPEVELEIDDDDEDIDFEELVADAGLEDDALDLPDEAIDIEDPDSDLDLDFDVSVDEDDDK